MGPWVSSLVPCIIVVSKNLFLGNINMQLYLLWFVLWLLAELILYLDMMKITTAWLTTTLHYYITTSSLKTKSRRLLSTLSATLLYASSLPYHASHLYTTGFTGYHMIHDQTRKYFIPIKFNLSLERLNRCNLNFPFIYQKMVIFFRIFLIFRNLPFS